MYQNITAVLETRSYKRFCIHFFDDKNSQVIRWGENKCLKLSCTLFFCNDVFLFLLVDPILIFLAIWWTLLEFRCWFDLKAIKGKVFSAQHYFIRESIEGSDSIKFPITICNILIDISYFHHMVLANNIQDHNFLFNL